MGACITVDGISSGSWGFAAGSFLSEELVSNQNSGSTVYAMDDEVPAEKIT